MICDLQQKKYYIGELWCGSPLFDSAGQQLSLATEESREVHALDDCANSPCVVFVTLNGNADINTLMMESWWLSDACLER